MNEVAKMGASGSSTSAGTGITTQTGSRQPEYFEDAGEAAKFLGINRRTVLQMAREGIIPAHPLGDGKRKLWRFLLSELDEWMRSRVNSARRPCSPNRRDLQ
jgi:excisionase family DNA binding protein